MHVSVFGVQTGSIATMLLQRNATDRNQNQTKVSGFVGITLHRWADSYD